MISPQLSPDPATSRPAPPPEGPFNVSLDHSAPPPEEPRLAVVAGADMNERTTTDAVVSGLWMCLVGSIVAGLGVSAVLGALVFALGRLG